MNTYIIWFKELRASEVLKASTPIEAIQLSKGYKAGKTVCSLTLV